MAPVYLAYPVGHWYSSLSLWEFKLPYFFQVPAEVGRETHFAPFWGRNNNAFHGIKHINLYLPKKR